VTFAAADRYTAYRNAMRTPMDADFARILDAGSFYHAGSLLLNT